MPIDPVSIMQPSLTSGEFSRELQARIDLARYYTGLKTCRNFVVMPAGGVKNRAGTKYCGETKDSTKKSRIIPFIFSDDQALVMELGDEYIRFWSEGAQVLYASGPSVGLPVDVVSPYDEDQLFNIEYAQKADVVTTCHPDVYPNQLSRLSPTNDDWDMGEFPNVLGPFQDMNVDESITLYASAETGTVTLYASDDLFTSAMVGMLMRIEQAPDVETSRWEVSKSVGLNKTRRAGSNYYTSLTSGTTGTVKPTILEGVENDGDPGVVWEYLHSGFGVVEITAFTSTTEVTATVKSRLPASIVTGSTTATITNAVSDAGNTYVTVTTAAAHGFSTGDVVDIAGVVGMTDINTTWTATATGTNTLTIPSNTVQIYTSGGTVQNALTGTNTYKWSLGAWYETTGYPAAVIYDNQRQKFAGSPGYPQTVWESASGGAYTDFGQSVELLDDDALTYELAAARAGRILHLVPISDLMALTSEGVWSLIKESGELLPSANSQGRGGASTVAPVVVGSDALYIQRKGKAIKALRYYFDSDNYKGRDLSITASHLFKGKTVVDWAYQEVPFSCVWIVLDDGALVALTYFPEQEVVGWHRHDSDGATFESVCCIPEGDEDVVYFVVQRTINGTAKRFVEKMESRDFTDIKDAFFVDCGLTYDGRDAGEGVGWTLTTGAGWTHDDTLTFTADTAVFTGASDVGDVIVLEDSDGEALRLVISAFTSTTTVSVRPHRDVPAEFQAVACSGYDLARDTFTGLDHLEGEELAVFADGGVHSSETVVSGEITIDPPAVVVHAGKGITADIETLSVNAQGGANLDKVKNIPSVSLMVEETRGLWAGPDADNLLEFKPEMSGEYDEPISTSEGIKDINIISDWSTAGRVFIRQSDPLPVTILAVIPEVGISDG